MNRFGRRVNKYVKEREFIKRNLVRRGPALMKQLLKGMSQSELARATGVTVGLVNNILHRRHPCSPEYYVTLAELETRLRRAVK